MIIGIDLDGTFTGDELCFRELIITFIRYGHRCIIVTNRQWHEAPWVEEAVIGSGVECVITTSGRPKRECALARGYDVDIWIDDNPILVDYGQRGLEMVGERPRRDG